LGSPWWWNSCSNVKKSFKKELNEQQQSSPEWGIAVERKPSGRPDNDELVVLYGGVLVQEQF
jgi:hypothetical protein